MITIRVLTPSDQPALEAFLRPRLESSIFLVSNSRRAGLVDQGRPFEGTYFAAFAGGDMVGVVAHYWLGNLIFQAPPEHVGALAEAAVKAAVRPAGGLLGPAEQVARAVEVLRVSDDEIQLDEVEGLYSLPLDELVVPGVLAAGRLRGRRIEHADLDRVTAWRVAYSLETLQAEDTPELRESCRHAMESSCDRGDTWVLEDTGEVVASTSFNATTEEAVQVGGVWTPPEARGRGYGRTVVAASLLAARDESVAKAILFTGDENLPAIKAYLALGFRRIGDYRLVLLCKSRDFAAAGRRELVGGLVRGAPAAHRSR